MIEWLKSSFKTRGRDILETDGSATIQIPASMVEQLGWDSRTELELLPVLRAGVLMVRSLSHECSLCQAVSEDAQKVQRGYLCPQCLAAIKQGD